MRAVHRELHADGAYSATKQPNRRGSRTNAFLSSVCVCCLLTLVTACHDSTTHQESRFSTRVVIIGFDGLDPTLAQRWMNSGDLPNLSQLAKDGDFVVLGSPPPAESPVAWCSFATGTNPGKHNVYDFLERAPDTYAAIPDLYKTRRQEFFLNVLPHGAPHVEPRRGGTPFWVSAAAAGARAVVIAIPMTFPPDDFPGYMLSGFPAPDLHGTAGTYQYWASDSSVYLEPFASGGTWRRLQFDNGAARATLEGPFNPFASGALSVPMEIRRTQLPRVLSIRIAGQNLTLEEGHWSPWVPVTFEANFFIRYHGIVQFFVIEADDEVRLFATPVNVDPRALGSMRISTPPTFAADLAARLGPYRTVGWAEFADKALKAGAVDEAVFMQDAVRAFDDRERLILDSLDHKEWDLFIAATETTDRVSHMMWRFIDPAHPLYDPKLVPRYGDSILKMYRRADDLLGKVRKRLPSTAVLLVMSDHGFHSFRRAVNLNTWLVQNGFMRLDRSAESDASNGFQGVDWSRTKAYALGLGQIYINLSGRESQGSVAPGREYFETREAIRRQLLELRDPKDNGRVVRDVYRGDEIYKGPYMDNAPDLVVGFNDGYRVGFTDAAGQLSRTIVQDNEQKWSGDHCGAAAEIAGGVLFANRKFADRHAQITDIAPTVLRVLGISLPPELDGHPLFAPVVASATPMNTR